MFDVGGLGLLIGQCIGRWGNFVNQEAYGAPTAGSLPWGMTGTTIINDPVVIAKQAELDAAGNGLFALVHPCFLYESLWCLIGFIALHFYSKKLKTFDGEIFLLYIIWYGLGRFWIEALRTDSLFIGPFKVSQIVAGGCVIVGLALFILGKIFKTKKRGYVMYKDSEACKEKNEAYYARQKMLEEKAKAKKAMKQAGEEAPSIIVDDEAPDNEKTSADTEKKEEKTEKSESNEENTPDKTEEE